MRGSRRGWLVGLASLLLTARAQAAAPGVGETTLEWWGHAAWFVSTPGGARIAIDPFLDNPKAPKGTKPPATLDAILVTHGHQDHVGQTVQLARTTGAAVITSFELGGLIGASRTDAGNIGGSVRVKDVLITMVEAVHSSGFGQDAKNPRYGGPAMGFVLAVDGGPVIYHAGDTDVFASMALIRERYHPTVALLPIGGHYTMDPQGAALAAGMLGVKTVIPMHYGTFPPLTGTPEELKAALAKQKNAPQVLVAVPGQPFRADQYR